MLKGTIDRKSFDRIIDVIETQKQNYNLRVRINNPNRIIDEVKYEQFTNLMPKKYSIIAIYFINDTYFYYAEIIGNYYVLTRNLNGFEAKIILEQKSLHHRFHWAYKGLDTVNFDEQVNEYFAYAALFYDFTINEFGM